MSNEPKYLRDRDRAWGHLHRLLDEADAASYWAGYEAGRKDERAGLPHARKIPRPEVASATT